MDEITARAERNPWPESQGWVHVRPVGIASATTWRNVADVTNFLYENPDVKLVIEIGANFCGFAALMVARTVVFPDFAYLGIEKETNRSHPGLEQYMATHPRCKVIWDDCFNEAVKAQAKAWIAATKGHALVWCDGNDKPREIREYSPFLRVGDYLMMHDYSHEKLCDENPSWQDCQPLVDSGEYEIAVPDYWAVSAMMFLLRKVK